MHKEENYLDYILQGYIDFEQENTNATYTVYVLREDSRNENDFTFIEKTELVGREDAFLNLELPETTFSKARARILTEFFDKGKEYCQTINNENDGLRINPMGDDMIQKRILKGLVNIRKRNPLEYKEQNIRLDGFCNILGINANQFLFNASLLYEDGFIGTMDTKSHNLKNGGIYITSLGVHELNFISGPEMPISDDVKLKIEGTIREKKDTIVNKSNMAILYAIEDTPLAEEIGSILKEKNMSAFYDCYEDAAILGKDLYEYLNYIYNESAMFCIVLVSKSYADRLWTDHSRKFAHAKAYREKMDSILPVIIDGTKLPGLPESVGYFKYDKNSDALVSLAIRKLNKLY